MDVAHALELTPSQLDVLTEVLASLSLANLASPGGNGAAAVAAPELGHEDVYLHELSLFLLAQLFSKEAQRPDAVEYWPDPNSLAGPSGAGPFGAGTELMSPTRRSPSAGAYPPTTLPAPGLCLLPCHCMHAPHVERTVRAQRARHADGCMHSACPTEASSPSSHSAWVFALSPAPIPTAKTTGRSLLRQQLQGHLRSQLLLVRLCHMGQGRGPQRGGWGCGQGTYGTQATFDLSYLLACRPRPLPTAVPNALLSRRRAHSCMHA